MASACVESALQAPQPSQHAAAASLQADPRLAGVWVKDGAASDSMDSASDLMHINGLLKTATRLIRGVEIELKDGKFTFAVISIPLIKAREAYPLDGSIAAWPRRDLRKGQHQGNLTVQPGGGVVISVQWDDPYAAKASDVYTLVGPDELHVVSSLESCEGSTSFKIVYHRKK